MKQTIIESKYTIHDKVWYLRGNGIPRYSEIEGMWLIYDHRDEENHLQYLVNGWEKHEYELFDTLEELAAKHRFTAPNQAKILLDRDKAKPKSEYNAQELEFLEERVKLYNPSKAVKKKKILQ